MRSKRIGLVWIERAGYHGPLPSPPGASPRWAAAPPPRHLQLPAVARGVVFLQLFLLLQRCLPPNKCVVICFSSLPDHVCIPWPPLPRTASTRSGLNRRWLVAPGAVGLCLCSEDRLGLEHHLVRLREHHGEHVHDVVPLLLCLRPWRCRTRSVTPASWNGLLER